MSVDASRRLGAATPGDGQSGLDGRGRPRNFADDGRFADCIDRLEEAVSELARAGVSGVSGRVLVDGAAVLAKAISRLGAVRGNMLVAIGEQESWRVSGVRTFAQWNEKASGQSPSAAMKEIKRGAGSRGGPAAHVRCVEGRRAVRRACRYRSSHIFDSDVERQAERGPRG